ncbi:mediator of DNA damage checkpoint protein 1 [Betta splendens]|uniref:Mediator of DNA damage checkpoint protein 1 n=1 Tax=Betta splendens TaxID=158456 RepID=A0A6P7KQ48_BETSP|nr:mediator of DNA damage checkpoint protein 1 [Betta splendens]XP_028984738.1 mediator of DNA damage checkpoint protein 1 [Betta splendens]XP_040923650.1 mediator of DNA damage checkpoint protein 1 [Betta splendens]
MDATQVISEPILESDEEESEAENENKKGRPLAKLYILQNEHIPETELPLFMGDNVLGRDPSTCTLALSAPSISKRHATICISVFRTRRQSEMDMEALVWDLGSMNGTQKGRLKLTPNVRYALSDGDRLVLADIPCHFVSCAMNSASPRGDLRTPVSRNSRVKAELPEASQGTGGSKGTGNPPCVSRETKAEVSLTKTPVSSSCLSFEQTPVQPQGTLVSESDSESEDERRGKRTRTRMLLASDSDSHKSSPTCSTFLSPPNKIVPESEDESPITPSSSFKKEPFKGVSPSKKQTEVDMDQQQLLQKQEFVLGDDSEEEGSTPVVMSRKKDQHVTAKLESKVHLAGDDDLAVCTSEVSTNPVANFNMDSDTDMEGEEEGFTSAGHVTLNSNQVNQPPNTEQFHMDSDTDVDDDEGASHRVPKTVPCSDDHVKPFHVIQPEGIAVDSDTDVDDEPALSDGARKAKPMSSACTADTALSKQQKDFCLDSDTDVDEEAERECGQNKSSSKTDVSQAMLDTNSVSPNSIHAAPHRLSLDSDTEDKAQPTPALSEAPMVFAPTEALPTADTKADFGILPDSDTDVEADSPPVVPVAATTLSVSHTNMSEALQSDSSADTNVEESSISPAGNVDKSADHGVDSSTDVDYKETHVQISELHREVTPELPFPAVQACSTPVQCLGGEMENMETQAFLIPSVSLGSIAVPAIASSSSDSQEEEDFVVAETQSFVLHDHSNNADDHITEPIHGLEPSDGEKNGHSSNGRSFHLGLSDSSHLQCQTQDLAMEITQAFVPVDKSLNLEDTQAYVSDSTPATATAENATEIEVTQAYGVEGEPVTCLVTLEKDKVHFALEATQAYISEPCSDSENEIDEINCPTSSTLAIAETQPMSGFEKEESLASETEEREECGEVAQPQEQFLNKAVCIAETQPMQTCSDEDPEIPINSELSSIETPVDTVADGESDEDSIPVSRKRKAKPLQLEETQSLWSPGGPPTETQPVDAVRNRENGESDDEDIIPGPRKRKAKPLQLEEEQTQPLTNAELSVGETQPVHIGFVETQAMSTRRNGESDVESEGKKSPTFINPELSAVQTQPVEVPENVESDEEDSFPVSRKRRAKPQQLEDTQTLSSSEASTHVSQPVGACEDEESIKEDSIPGPGPLQPTNPEISTVETQATNESIRHPEPGTSGVSTTNKGVTEEKLKAEEQSANCSSSKRQISGKKKALSKSRRRVQSMLDEVESEEEEIEQPKKARGNKCVSPQKDEEEEKRLEIEINQHQQVESIGLIKSKHEERNSEKDEKENGVSEAIKREEEEIEGQHEEERKEHDKQGRFQELDEQQEHKADENMLKVPTRGRRTSRRTAATTTAATNDDVPARRTRSRSNSSNSVSSERSASSISTQEIRGRGRGRGRGGTRISEPPQAATARSSNRRRTVAAESPQGGRSRSNSSNSLNSELSSCSEVSQSRGRGGRQRGRGRKTDSTPSVSSQSDQNSAPKPGARGRRSRAAEGSTSGVFLVDEEKVDSLQAATTRGQQQASAHGSEPVAAHEQGQSNQEGCHDGEESLLTKRNVRGRGQKAKTEPLETLAVSDGDEAKHNRMGRKREMVQNTEGETCRGKDKAQTANAAEEEGKENPVQAKRRGRASTQAKKNTKESASEVEAKEESEDPAAAGKRQRGRPSAAKKMKTEEPEDGSGTSVTAVNQEANLVAPQPRTPTSSVSRKRQLPVDSSPVAKSPRSSCASPVASGQAARQSYKVLFTGVVDEAGGKVLTRLGGSMAKGVSDMNCLVTDKVRRTVKFLCAVAKGIPIVTTHWLEKSGKAGSFLPPNAFAVKDPEQEKKFSFSLQESLRTASSQLLLQGYEIHVTKSVKPEPPQMKDIISCSGATFLPKMPSSYKLQTVVISCEEDWLLCGPAVSASLPVVTAEFILTGILQQKVDVQAYALPPPATNPQPAAGRGRGRKKT